MADCYHGIITIGGKLSRSKLQEFLSVLRDSGAGPNGEDGFPDDVIDEASLRALSRYDNLRLEDYDARDGEFYALQYWLQEHRMSYDAYSGSYDYPPSITFVRPIGDEYQEETFVCDDRGFAHVSIKEVCKAREALDVGNIDAALKFLDFALGMYRDLTPLPPFEIVD